MDDFKRTIKNLEENLKTLQLAHRQSFVNSRQLPLLIREQYRFTLHNSNAGFFLIHRRRKQFNTNKFVIVLLRIILKSN